MYYKAKNFFRNSTVENIASPFQGSWLLVNCIKAFLKRQHITPTRNSYWATDGRIVDVGMWWLLHHRLADSTDDFFVEGDILKLSDAQLEQHLRNLRWTRRTTHQTE